jgi:hypothetical protein
MQLDMNVDVVKEKVRRVSENEQRAEGEPRWIVTDR